MLKKNKFEAKKTFENIALNMINKFGHRIDVLALLLRNIFVDSGVIPRQFQEPKPEFDYKIDDIYKIGIIEFVLGVSQFWNYLQNKYFPQNLYQSANMNITKEDIKKERQKISWIWDYYFKFNVNESKYGDTLIVVSKQKQLSDNLKKPFFQNNYYFVRT